MTLTFCLLEALGTLRETLQLPPSARRSSTTPLSCVNNGSMCRKQPLNLAKHQIFQPQLREGSCGPFIYAQDRKRTWVLHFLARQQFTVSEIEEYAMERRRRREGSGQNNYTTNGLEHTFKTASCRTTLSAYVLAEVSSRHGLKQINEQVTYNKEA